MIILEGRALAAGVAAGVISVFKHDDTAADNKPAGDAQTEIAFLQDASGKLAETLQKEQAAAALRGAEQEAEILGTHLLMLEDEDFLNGAEKFIRTDKVSAAAAVKTVAEQYARSFEALDDAYLRARAQDVRDIGQRLLKLLLGAPNAVAGIPRQSILTADYLLPSEILALAQADIAGIVFMETGAASHAQLMAASLGIPVVAGVGRELSSEWEGLAAVLDGINGRLYLEPDAAARQKLTVLQKQYDKERRELLALKNRAAVTASGRQVEIAANIAGTQDVAAVLANEADGVGLLRSEFLFMNRQEAPTEDEQFAVYKQIVEALHGKRVIIRTIDVGNDKQAAYLHLPAEENPALGLRGIRISLLQPESFKTQVRAVLRASAFGKAALMFPMVVSVSELRQAKGLVEDSKAELRRAGIAFDEGIEIGIMVETPAAAMLSAELAQEADFFSIGSNDLSQYIMAIDRGNKNVAQFEDGTHEALLRMIKLTVDNAHKAGLWVGLCGGLAAETEFTETLVNMGLDELSVPAGKILPLKKIICNM